MAKEVELIGPAGWISVKEPLAKNLLEAGKHEKPEDYIKRRKAEDEKAKKPVTAEARAPIEEPTPVEPPISP